MNIRMMIGGGGTGGSITSILYAVAETVDCCLQPSQSQKGVNSKAIKYSNISSILLTHIY